jgi:hypothetical protein
MAEFASVLDQKAPDAPERPKPYPVGTYLGVVKGLPAEGKSAQKQTPQVDFIIQFLQPGEDVDQEALKDVLKGESLASKTMKHTFYTTENAVWRLDKFLIEDLKIPGSRGRRSMIAEAPGRQVVFSIKHETSQDGTQIFAKIGDTAPAE